MEINLCLDCFASEGFSGEFTWQFVKSSQRANLILHCSQISTSLENMNTNIDVFLVVEW